MKASCWLNDEPKHVAVRINKIIVLRVTESEYMVIHIFTYKIIILNILAVKDSFMFT
jgi:hypothetical protein